MNNPTTTIKPKQAKTIYDHEWSDINITGGEYDKDSITVYPFDPEVVTVTFNKFDAIAIAKHFNLIPEKSYYNQECSTSYSHTESGLVNGELVETLKAGDVVQTLDNGTTYDVVEGRLTPNHKLSELNGFMSEGGE